MNDAVPLYIGDPALAAYGNVVRTSLPISLKESDTAKGALVAVAGGDGWIERVVRIANDGAAGILVEDPHLVRDAVLLTALRTVADRVPVLLRRPFLCNPAIRQPATGRPEAGGSRMVVSELFVPSMAMQQRLLFDHISLVRALAAPLEVVRSAKLSKAGYSVSGILRGGAAFLAGGIATTAQPPHVRLRMLRPPERLTVEIFPDLTSRPAHVMVTDAEGERVEPKSFESATRLGWRTLLDAYRLETPLRDVFAYVDDVTIFERVDEAVG